MMKAELKTAGEDEEKEQKKKEKLEKIEAAAAERKKKAEKRVLVTNDRLFDDKASTFKYQNTLIFSHQETLLWHGTIFIKLEYTKSS